MAANTAIQRAYPLRDHAVEFATEILWRRIKVPAIAGGFVLRSMRTSITSAPVIVPCASVEVR